MLWLTDSFLNLWLSSSSLNGNFCLAAREKALDFSEIYYDSRGVRRVHERVLVLLVCCAIIALINYLTLSWWKESSKTWSRLTLILREL